MRTVFDYFLGRFPRIGAGDWIERFRTGQVFTATGPLSTSDPFIPLEEVFYLRQVSAEPPVRTDVRVVWRDEDLLVVDKPPFLPVTPGGYYQRHCLLHLLRERGFGDELVPLHRLDAATSGLVMLSLRRCSRSHYSRLFQPPHLWVLKEYLAVCEVRREPPPRMVLEDHVCRDPAAYHRQVMVAGRPSNARLTAWVSEREGGHVLLRVLPHSGRKHQIRVQLAGAGLPVVGDRLYGTGPSRGPGELGEVMLLDAHRLIVRGHPVWQSEAPLNAVWTSARSAAAMLAAVRVREP